MISQPACHVSVTGTHHWKFYQDDPALRRCVLCNSLEALRRMHDARLAYWERIVVNMNLRDALAASQSMPRRARNGDLIVEEASQGVFNLYGNTNPGIPFATGVRSALLLDYLKSINTSVHTGWLPA